VETVLPLSTASLGQHAERDSTEARAASAPAPDLASPSPSAASARPPSTPDSSDPRDAPVRRVVSVLVPLALRSLGNRREPFWTRARRTRREHAAVLSALAGLEPPPLPLVVEFVRTGWNRLDVDGLVASVKGPIDACSQWIGVDDRDPRVHWHLAQSVTRKVRIVRTGARALRREAAASLRIVVRPWTPDDLDDPLRVLAVPPEVQS
jgi:hypothetical protein